MSDYDIDPKDKLEQTIDTLTTATPDPNVRYMAWTRKVSPGKFVHETVKLTKSPENGFWRDPEGGIWAFAENKSGMDPRLRCGSGFFSLPAGDPRNELCAPHDFEYSCPVYTAYHTEEESNKELEERMIQGGFPISAHVFYDIVEAIGDEFWPNPKTAN